MSALEAVCMSALAQAYFAVRTEVYTSCWPVAYRFLSNPDALYCYRCNCCYCKSPMYLRCLHSALYFRRVQYRLTNHCC